jgi:uncharacterized FlaG/YvyC family protein
MNETSIKPISSVRPPEPGAPSKVQAANQAEMMTAHKIAVPESEASAKQMEIHSQKAENISNVSIHFRLDDKTNELTVFVVDRKTRRVVRSIPASELHKLQAGDLLKLTA